MSSEVPLISPSVTLHLPAGRMRNGSATGRRKRESKNISTGSVVWSLQTGVSRTVTRPKREGWVAGVGFGSGIEKKLVRNISTSSVVWSLQTGVSNSNTAQRKRVGVEVRIWIWGRKGSG